MTTPICTGEDIYLKEGFKPLLEARGVSVIHPDLATSGGILETKRIGDLAQDHGDTVAAGHLDTNVDRVVVHEVVPQHLGDVRHAHRRTWMAGIGLLHRIHAQGADGVSELFA